MHSYLLGRTKFLYAQFLLTAVLPTAALAASALSASVAASAAAASTLAAAQHFIRSGAWLSHQRSYVAMLAASAFLALAAALARAAAVSPTRVATTTASRIAPSLMATRAHPMPTTAHLYLLHPCIHHHPYTLRTPRLRTAPVGDGALWQQDRVRVTHASRQATVPHVARLHSIGRDLLRTLP